MRNVCMLQALSFSIRLLSPHTDIHPTTAAGAGRDREVPQAPRGGAQELAHRGMSSIDRAVMEQRYHGRYVYVCR